MGMERILKYYYTNNAAKLHDMVDKILSKFGGLSDKDMDDFYSLANEVFVDAMRRDHDGLSFDVFLYSCLQNRVKAEMTKRNREKRRADRMSIPIDMPFGDDEEVTLGDMIADSSDVEQEVLEREEGINGTNRKIEAYLGRLSKRQRKIVKLLMASYEAKEIRNILHITQKEYADAMLGIRSYENISILF